MSNLINGDRYGISILIQHLLSAPPKPKTYLHKCKLLLSSQSGHIQPASRFPLSKVIPLCLDCPERNSPKSVISSITSSYLFMNIPLKFQDPVLIVIILNHIYICLFSYSNPRSYSSDSRRFSFRKRPKSKPIKTTICQTVSII
jgi:hypothetical protein